MDTLSIDGPFESLIFDAGTGFEVLSFGFFNGGTAGTDRDNVFDVSGVPSFDASNFIDSSASYALHGGNDRFVGHAINENVQSGLGDDTLLGNGGDDFLEDYPHTQQPLPGFTEQDFMYRLIDFVAERGLPVDTLMEGGDGNDVLISWLGRDTLRGGAGDDLLSIRARDQNFLARPFDAVIDGGAGTDRLLLFVADQWEDRVRPLIVNTLNLNAQTSVEYLQIVDYSSIDDNWVVHGSDLDGRIDLSHIRGYIAPWMTSNDVLVTDPAQIPRFDLGGGEDNFLGSQVSDRADGGSGADWLFGEGGNDTLAGGEGDDALGGGAGQDWLGGDAGDDRLWGDVGSDTLDGGDGTDGLIGGDGDDSLSGGAGEDTLLGEAGNDSLRGGDGGDRLNGGDGDDVIVGGESAADLRDVILGGDGNDSVDAGAGNDEVYGGNGNDTIEGGFGVDEIIGQGGDDVLTGSAFSDLIFGGDGNDFINGGFGSDRVNGGAGADRFYHLGIADHGSDWIQDYRAGGGDVLVWGGGAALRSQFQVNFAETAGAGQVGVKEAFVIYRPTGQILWALIDGDAQGAINLQIGGLVFDLLS